MKLFTIVFAAITLLMSTQVQAQGTKEQMKTKSNAESSTSASGASKIFGEMLVFEINGKTVVKVSFDPILGRMGADKDALMASQQIGDFKFTSMGQALNVLSSHGWMVEHVWTTLERSGAVQHFILSHDVAKLTPVSPWLSKNTKKGTKG